MFVVKTITSLEVAALGSNSKKIALSDGNGYYIAEFTNEMNPQSDYKYINNEEYKNISNNTKYTEEYVIDPIAIYNYMHDKKAINAHGVNPIYIKKIGVELDKKSNN